MQISIRSIASLSALGTQRDAARAYARDESALKQIALGGRQVWVGPLPEALAREVAESLSETYGRLDPSVWYAIWTARQAIAAAGWQDDEYGLNIGSSRGATHLWEKYHDQFRDSASVSTPASPSTTLGNIASWVAHDLGCKGPALSHSITCSSALHAVVNGCAWLKAGFASRFLAGGSEAPLTPFTLAQMEALKIYSTHPGPLPCRPLDPDKPGNTFVLGEGAAMVCLEAGAHPDALALLSGFGYGTEPLQHGASLSADGKCLQRSMRKALGDTDPAEVDAVVLHAPGTRKGDQAEVSAIESVFGDHRPQLFTNKWKIGHTLGASGLLSVELALLLLRESPVRRPAYFKGDAGPRPCRYVLVNAVGFGGNAVSLLLERT